MEKDLVKPNNQDVVNAAENESQEETAGGAAIMPPQFSLDNDNTAVQAQSVTEEQSSQNASSETWDRHTNRRIAGIHPDVQASALNFVNKANADLGLKLRVTSGLRTFSEQDELYAKGRTKPGGRVTNARGGQSYHNYGLAIDVVEITDAGKANWSTDWAAIGALGESLGWEWGGNWSGFVDKPHFQMTFGFSTSQLRSMYTAQGGNFVSLEGGTAPEAVDQEQEQEQEQDQDTGGNTPAMALSGSVGKGGKNQYDDVKVVQQKLNKSGANLVEDGDAGPLTIAAIEAFQMGQFGWKDGKVDVGGKTWDALVNISAPQPSVYTVKRGDTISKIAADLGVSVSDILSANPEISDPNKISVGQKIVIPVQGSGDTTPEEPVKEEPANDSGNENGGGSDPDEGGGTGLIYGSKVSTAFAEKVILISAELGISPNYLMAAMAFETGGSFDPAQKNFAGSGATGLIQFMPRTAIGLGTTTAELAQMTAVQQLDYVKAYFQPYAGRLSTLEDLYMAILWPRGIGKDNSYILWSQGSRAYTLNSGLDTNSDGSVTKGEAAGKVRERYEAGQDDMVTVGGATAESDVTPDNTGLETEDPAADISVSEPASSNFSIAEFHSKDGTPVPPEYYENIQELMNNLEVLREELDGNSIRINSGYRSPAHNANVGGASNSQHKYGRAADIVVANYSPGLVHTTIKRLISTGKMKEGGLGSYNTFTHYDIRGSKARW